MNVFISHSHNDSDVALELADRLIVAGHRVWRDEPAALGESVSGAIATAIECADAYIIVVSRHLLDSEFSLLEVGGALAESESSGKPVIPVLLDRDVEVPALLRDRVYVDLSSREERQHGFEAIEAVLARGADEVTLRRSSDERQVELFAAAERYLDDEIDHYLSMREHREFLLRRRFRLAVFLTSSLALFLVALVTLVTLSGGSLLVPLVSLAGGLVIGMLTVLLGSVSGFIWPSRRMVDLLIQRKASADDDRH